MKLFVLVLRLLINLILLGEKIIEACKVTGAEAIHPGYGFLSENAAFARLVKRTGLILIGPTPEAMEIMGNKLSAKAAALKYNIPMVPGTEEAITDVEEAKETSYRSWVPDFDQSCSRWWRERNAHC